MDFELRPLVTTKTYSRELTTARAARIGSLRCAWNCCAERAGCFPVVPPSAQGHICIREAPLSMRSSRHLPCGELNFFNDWTGPTQPASMNHGPLHKH
jgi:hypothetical protein